MTTTPEKRFAFGRNWQSFIDKKLSEERLQQAQQHLVQFCGQESLTGKSFLDIGSGSGLHSYAAFLAGAAKIVSFDYDHQSVLATQALWRMAGSPANWTVQQGSVLDAAFMASLGHFDLVYSWGVLHHTGDMETAINLASQCVQPGGCFYFGLYDSDWSAESPEFWFEVKQKYLDHSPLRKRLDEIWYLWRFELAKTPANLPVLFRKWVNYKENRGMDMMHDVRDWLGGWPMQYSRFADVVQQLSGLGFQYNKSKMGEIVTEYLFAKPSHPALVKPLILNVIDLRTKHDFARLDKNQPIYIFGAGQGGQIIQTYLKDCGYNICGFISNSAGSQHSAVMSLETMLSQHPQGQIIIASAAIDEISMQLINQGITTWFNSYPMIRAHFAGYV
ncbi:class I SAM-dependent methyltransferase [Rheinheimera texasensis]|uniref:class I SAM-dependent methyltransferase n=1 Tax=Rheinheimera texasensis TaxID=306205 RepID=UPI0032B24CC4